MITQKQKNIIIAFILVLITVSIFTYYKYANNDTSELGVDLSDIEQMNIGSEMPQLLYGDNNSAVIQGTFGLVVYNINDSIVTNRISYERLKSYGISMLYAAVSQDGMTIYIGNDDMNGGSNFTHQYNIRTRVVKKISQQPVNVFTPIRIKTPGYNEEYDKYFDFQYLINDTIVEVDNSFIYLRANLDWSMKSLQFIICRYVDGVTKIHNVF
ncbi:hypothetical protein [Alkaliphilus transvaalensis]|uniref:hypothetical protein n=1 Tax=Alkaliphilus transvaalensis TaxID=114628 RepID=UPI00047B62A8|nr:hypothetical protein [Alkaliphilus transvaalensis]